MQGAAAGAPKDPVQGGKPDGGKPGSGKPDSPAPRKSPSALGAVAVVLVGAAITGALVGTVVAPGRVGSGSQVSEGASGSEPMLDKVAPSEIAKAIVTLDPTVSEQVAADAKACKAPIAWVTLTRQPGTTGGLIRIRSGAYLSPAFQATDVPQRIAMPYPAPYQTGRGVLWVIGEGNGIEIDLYPGWHAPSLNGTAPINVIWTPKDPC
jgi:hypothetical protein